MQRILFTLLVALAPAFATAQSQLPALRLVGADSLHYSVRVGGLPLGGLSGIDYDDSTPDIFYAVADKGEPLRRFYRLKLRVSDTGVRLDTSAMEQVPMRGGNADATQPESIRLLRKGRKKPLLLWADEGENSDVRISPSIQAMDLAGNVLPAPAFRMPDAYRLTANVQQGPQDNKAFEAMTLDPAQEFLWVATENSLWQDPDSLVRFTRFSTREKSAKAVSQFAYLLTDPGYGISEILATGSGNLLVLERKWDHRRKITQVRLLEVTPPAGPLESTPNHAGVEEGFTGQPRRGKLICDVTNLLQQQDIKADNLEGMCWGPPVRGNATLVFVSDNNFGNLHSVTGKALQPYTQFIVFEYVAGRW